MPVTLIFFQRRKTFEGIGGGKRETVILRLDFSLEADAEVSSLSDDREVFEKFSRRFTGSRDSGDCWSNTFLDGVVRRRPRIPSLGQTWGFLHRPNYPPFWPRTNFNLRADRFLGAVRGREFRMYKAVIVGSFLQPMKIAPPDVQLER